MLYFKDKTNSVHCIESTEFAYLLPEGSVEITNAEADALRAPTAAQIVADKWNAIKAERDRRKVGGIKVKVGTTNKWFHSDDASRIQQMGLVMMGTNMPADLQWKTLDGSFVAMTPAIAGNVFAAAAASDQAIFAVAEGHKTAMEASADPSTYDFSTGWPKIYGE
ncbi:MAG: DUF4376 domain-containing protein [Rhodocyclaceae bacterium]